VAGVLMPLWASYLIKVYAWRTMFANDGVVNWLLQPLNATVPQSGYVRVWLVLSYLWLPYMILPIYAGLERMPRSLIEASGDLGAGDGVPARRPLVPACRFRLHDGVPLRAARDRHHLRVQQDTGAELAPVGPDVLVVRQGLAQQRCDRRTRRQHPGRGGRDGR